MAENFSGRLCWKVALDAAALKSLVGVCRQLADIVNECTNMLFVNKGGTTEVNPFRPFIKDEKGF